jgi:predicted lipoprotein
LNFLKVIVFAALFVCTAPHLVWAEPDYRGINTNIAKKMVIPAYTRLAKAASVQSSIWKEACKSYDADTLTSLQQAFHGVADAWANVFHWNFGPITHLLGRDRFYHWPERRNAISKSLGRLLAKPDNETLKPNNFAQISVAAQGLPAMERLLFDQAANLNKPWNCKVGTAIAANLETIATSTMKEWSEEVYPLIERGEEHPIYFDGPKLTLNQIFTELLTGFTIIRDQKILPVLGSSAKKAKPNLVEGRRSGRFNQNLILNLHVLLETDAVFAGHVPLSEGISLSKLRAAVMEQARALPPLGQVAYDKEGRKQYLEFTITVSELQKSMVQIYTEHLGLSLGFNSLDGD